MKRTRFGGTLGKYLLLLLCLGLLAGFFYWKAQHGWTGRIEPMPETTKDYIAFLRQGPQGQTTLYLVRADGTEKPKPLTNDSSGKLSPAWSPDGKQICYAGEVAEGRSVTHQLFLVGGGTPRQATYGSMGKISPAWRHDGKQIAFLSGGTLKVMDPNGTNVVQVYPEPHRGGGGQDSDSESSNSDQDPFRKPPITFFRWSSNNATIAALQVADDAGQDVKGQANWWDKPEGGGQPTDTASSISEPESVFLLPGSGMKPVPLMGAVANRASFAWYPDGKRLAVALSASRGQHAILVYRADEPLLRPEALFLSRPYELPPVNGVKQRQSIAAENPAISPDGKQIAFEVWRVDGAEDRTELGIAVAPADNGSVIRVFSQERAGSIPVKIKGRALNPRWSPDGTRLLYTVPDQMGRRDLYVAGADGSNPILLTKDAKADNFDAVWSPARK
jgi:Tol biopolymer transport system component